MFDLILASKDIFWIIVLGDFLETFVLRLSDLLFITLVPRLIRSLQGCRDEKAAWEDIFRQTLLYCCHWLEQGLHLYWRGHGTDSP